MYVLHSRQWWLDSSEWLTRQKCSSMPVRRWWQSTWWSDRATDLVSYPRSLHVSSKVFHTECSSCLTSSFVPSWKTQLATSASGEVDLVARSLLERRDQKFANSPSLMKCQTSLKEAWMTALSRTLVDVGIDMMLKLMDWWIWLWRRWKVVEGGMQKMFDSNNLLSTTTADCSFSKSVCSQG